MLRLCYRVLQRVSYLHHSINRVTPRRVHLSTNLCYKGVTKILQVCYKGVTEVSKQRHITNLHFLSQLSCHGLLADLLCYKSVTRVLQECYKSVTRVLQEWYKSVTRVLQESYKSVTRVLRRCYKLTPPFAVYASMMSCAVW
jgi:hypothetical protein